NTFTVTVDELDRDPEAVLDKAQTSQVMIYRENEPVAVFVPIDVWCDYLRQLEDAARNAPGNGPVSSQS
ncbi:MAG: hypothetical protein RXR52_28185, partial [Paraburkholderia sp.]